MTTGPDDEQPRRNARPARYGGVSRRTMAKIFLLLTPLWVLTAVHRWFDDDADPLTRWTTVGVAAVYLCLAVYWWRVLRRSPS
jgi:hypothetical protein